MAQHQHKICSDSSTRGNHSILIKGGCLQTTWREVERQLNNKGKFSWNHGFCLWEGVIHGHQCKNRWA